MTGPRPSPLVVGSVAAPDVATAARDAEAAVAAGADLVEVRADLLPDLDPYTARAVVPSGVPACYTLRSRAQGGGFAGSAADAARLRDVAAEAGFPWVDVECPPSGETPPLPTGVRTIVALHWPGPPPRDAAGHYARLRARRPTIVKLVGTATEPADAAPLLDLDGGAGDLAAFCQGEAGLPSRLLAARRGTAAVFGAAAADRPAAPGQPTVAELLGRYRLGDLGPGTAIYGVAGDPVAHSRGPLLHNAVFAALQHDGVYLPIRTRDLAGTVAFLRTHGLAGLSVTLPLKMAAAALPGARSPGVAACGSANTLVVRPEGLAIHSTDGAAVVAALAEALGGPLDGRRVLVLGAGGTARAAVHALRAAGATVCVTARRRTEAVAVAGAGAAVDWDRRESVPADAVVQATSLGMRPEDPLPLDPARVPGCRAVLDAVYTPPETPFVRAARAAGLGVATGTRMFLHQAAAQLRLWLQRDVPVALVTRAFGAGTDAAAGPS